MKASDETGKTWKGKIITLGILLRFVWTFHCMQNGEELRLQPCLINFLNKNLTFLMNGDKEGKFVTDSLYLLCIIVQGIAHLQ